MNSDAVVVMIANCYPYIYIYIYTHITFLKNCVEAKTSGPPLILKLCLWVSKGMLL